MAIYTTTLFSNKTITDYSRTNDLVGQLKNIFLMSPYVITISDNNPIDGSTERIVDLKVGDCSHYLQVRAYGETDVRLLVLNTANTNQINSTRLNLQNYPLKFLYSDHNFICNIDGFISFSRGEDNHWYHLSGNYCNNWNSDTRYTFAAAYMSVESSEGDSFLYPAYAYSSNTLAQFFNYVFRGLLNPLNYNFYYDGTSYYFCRDVYLFKDE